MGEINEALGRGKMFEVEGQRLEAFPARLEDMEEAVARFNKLAPTIAANYMARKIKKADGSILQLSEEDSIDNLMDLLRMIFRDIPDEILKKLDRKQVEAAIDFFLLG